MNNHRHQHDNRVKRVFRYTREMGTLWKKHKWSSTKIGEQLNLTHYIKHINLHRS